MAQKKRAPQTGAKKRKKPDTAAKRAAEQEPVRLPVRQMLAGACLLLAVLALFACLGAQGFLLSGVKNLLCGLLGSLGFYLSPLLFGLLFVLLVLGQSRPVGLRCLSAVLFVVLASAVMHLFLKPGTLPGGFAMLGTLFQTGVAGKSGGVLGGLVGILFELALSKVLGAIILCLLALLSLLGVCNITVGSILHAIQNRPRPDFESPSRSREDPAALVVNHIANKRIEHLERKRQASDFDVPVDGLPVGASGKKSGRPRKAAAISPDAFPVEQQSRTHKPQEAPFDEEPISGNTVIPPAAPLEPEEKQEEPDFDLLPEDAPEEETVDLGADAEVAQAVIQAVAPVEPTLEKVSAKDARASAQKVAQEIAENAQAPKPEYHFPPVNLLKHAPGGAADGTAEMRENTRRLNEALQSFKIEARICNVTRGPSVTRYEVELAQGVRLAKVTALQDDIALALGAVGVRISAIPDKIAVVGIEVPNKQVTTVALREVIDSPQFVKAKSRSSFAVGKDIGGACVVGDISKLPHMLIAGTTGSGKSVCMNSIIISLLYKAKPEEVKLIMVDPKMVELGIYNGIPHLLIPVVTDPKKAAGSLQWAVTEMMRRYKIMSDAGVRDLESFNRIMDSSGEEEPLPQIVVIIDELADLMLVAAKEVEESICRIAQMGRAAGMHLIIATQRPSADVITGLMKANIPSRIAFAVASAMESRIILDTQGAEKLVGRGDMLYAPLGKGKPKRIQGCFVSDAEVEAVAEFVKEHYVPDYSQEVLEEIERKAEQSGKGGKSADSMLDFESEDAQGDEMLPAAVDVILETGQASVSMLQRRLKLGYARAARIVDEMEERGIVGPFMGSKPRNILITKEQWQQMQSGQLPLEELTEEESADSILEKTPESYL